MLHQFPGIAEGQEESEITTAFVKSSPASPMVWEAYRCLMWYKQYGTAPKLGCSSVSFNQYKKEFLLSTLAEFQCLKWKGLCDRMKEHSRENCTEISTIILKDRKRGRKRILSEYSGIYLQKKESGKPWFQGVARGYRRNEVYPIKGIDTPLLISMTARQRRV